MRKVERDTFDPILDAVQILFDGLWCKIVSGCEQSFY
jgi:hypothetical protein